jgi:4'-phosphopantetheinyl transferase
MTDHVYLLDTRCLEDAELFHLWYEKMPAGRKEKIDAFRFDKDKRLSLGAGILLLYGLAAAGVQDAEISFGEHEKPFLAGREDLFFNLSHSGHLAACAVSERPVGIDIEEVRHFDERLVRYVFRDEESDWILKNTEHADTGYTMLWTLKESLMKYLGTGIALEAKKIRMDMAGPVRAECEGYDCGHLHFACFSMKDAQLSICSESEHFISCGGPGRVALQGGIIRNEGKGHETH